MTVSASIAFTQGAQVGAPGVAIIGTTGTNVVASNGNDSNVVTWTWTMVDVAQGSALSTGVIATGAVPNVSFSPDVPGGYLLSLTTTDNSGNTAVDYRAFQVPETTGRIIPPFKGTNQSLNFIISGVMNLRGWAPFQWAYDHEVDILSAGMVFEQSGTPIAGAPHFTLNVTGTGGTIADAGGGVALLNLASRAINYVPLNNSNASPGSPYAPRPGDWCFVDLTSGPVEIAPAGLSTSQWFYFKLKPGTTPTGTNALTVTAMAGGQIEQPVFGTFGSSLVFSDPTVMGASLTLVCVGTNLVIE